MAMTVKRRKGKKMPRVFEHKIADIPGGVSVNSSELGGEILYEGTPLSAPDNGICHVVKTAVVTKKVEASGTEVTVKKGHHFKVDDVLLLNVGGKASKITKIDTSKKEIDTLTLSATIGEIPVLSVIAEAKTETTGDDAELKYIPLSLSGTGFTIEQGDNIVTDAWVIGTTYHAILSPDIERHLKGIINY